MYTFGCSFKNDRMISVHFQGKLFNTKIIQVYTQPLTPKYINILFIIGDWNAKVGSQEIPGVRDKLGLEYKMEQGKG